MYQAVGQLVREFESGIHDKLVENASADVREAIRFVPAPTNGARAPILSVIMLDLCASSSICLSNTPIPRPNLALLTLAVSP